MDAVTTFTIATTITITASPTPEAANVKRAIEYLTIVNILVTVLGCGGILGAIRLVQAKRHRIGRWFRRTRDGLAARPGLDAPGAPPPVPAAPVALTTIVVPVTASAPVIPTPLAELLAAATPAAGAPFQAMVEWLHQWPAGECTVVDASGRRTKISSEASTATAVTATAAPAPPKSFPTSADDPGRGRARSSPLPLAHLTPGAAAAAVLGSPRQPRRRRGAPGVSRSDDF